MYSRPVGPSTVRVFDGSTFNATYPSGFVVSTVLSKPYLVAIRARADCTISIKQASYPTAQTIELVAHEERALEITSIVSIVSGTPGYLEMIF